MRRVTLFPKSLCDALKNLTQAMNSNFLPEFREIGMVWNFIPETEVAEVFRRQILLKIRLHLSVASVLQKLKEEAL